MSAQEKVRLTPDQQTLLITLYSKVRGCPKVLLDDPTADLILERVEYDFQALKVPTGTNLTVCLRTRQMDDTVSRFLAEHPQGRVLHLGCGLDSRCSRVAHPRADWVDLDLPEVIELRTKFYVQEEGYTMIACSVTDHQWMDLVPPGQKPTIVIAEGLMMYLAEAEVRALILALQSHFPGCQVVFDVFSTLTTRNIQRHPSVRSTGATIRWGIDDSRQIESWGDGISMVEEWYFIQSEYIRKLSWIYRLIFWIAGLFPVANKAQRILYFQL